MAPSTSASMWGEDTLGGDPLGGDGGIVTASFMRGLLPRSMVRGLVYEALGEGTRAARAGSSRSQTA